MASWAEDLKLYEQQKRGGGVTLNRKSTPREAAEPLRAYNGFARKQERFAREREYDIVAAEYRNATTEARVQKEEQRKLQIKKAEARAISHKYDTPYDVIDGVIKPGFQAPKAPYVRPVEYASPPVSSHGRSNTVQSYADFTEADKASPGFRDYDIVSGRHLFANHDEMLRTANEKALKRAKQNYLKAFPFDPILVRWNDEAKEKEWAAKDAEKVQSTRLRQLRQLPKRVRCSQGMLYDLFSLDERKGEFLEDQRAILDKKKETRPDGASKLYEKRVHDAGDRAYELKDTRQLNRILKNGRYASQRDYDILSNARVDESRKNYSSTRTKLGVTSLNASRRNSKDGYADASHTKKRAEKARADTFASLGLRGNSSPDKPVPAERISARSGNGSVGHESTQLLGGRYNPVYSIVDPKVKSQVSPKALSRPQSRPLSSTGSVVQEISSRPSSKPSSASNSRKSSVDNGLKPSSGRTSPVVNIKPVSSVGRSSPLVPKPLSSAGRQSPSLSDVGRVSSAGSRAASSASRRAPSPLTRVKVKAVPV